MIARALALAALVLAVLSPTDADARKRYRSQPAPSQVCGLLGCWPPKAVKTSRKRMKFRARAGAGRAGAESGLHPALKSEIALLRARHGHSAVRVDGGRRHSSVCSRGRCRLSCHATGEAFDGYLSPAAMATARSRGLGLITYSGRHRHVHVSTCRVERGYRGHKSG